MKLTGNRMKKIMKIYHGFNLYELEYFLSACADRITVPVDRGDSVECQKGCFAVINGRYIDIITEEFEEAMQREKENLRSDIKKQKQANNLLKDTDEKL
jgi:hypothetical protein